MWPTLYSFDKIINLSDFGSQISENKVSLICKIVTDDHFTTLQYCSFARQIDISLLYGYFGEVLVSRW